MKPLRLKPSQLQVFGLTCGLCLSGTLADAVPVENPKAAIPEADIPEEVLQVSILENAHSSLDGRSQTAAEQALERRQLQIKPEEVPARLSPRVLQSIELLRLRKLIKSLFPFFPFF